MNDVPVWLPWAIGAGLWYLGAGLWCRYSEFSKDLTYAGGPPKFVQFLFSPFFSVFLLVFFIDQYVLTTKKDRE